jgi:hypothetical protein
MKSSRRGVPRRAKRFDNQMNIFYGQNGAAGNEAAFAGFGTIWPPNRGHVNVGGLRGKTKMSASPRRVEDHSGLGHAPKKAMEAGLAPSTVDMDNHRASPKQADYRA